jgi:hypothetical protein
MVNAGYHALGLRAQAAAFGIHFGYQFYAQLVDIGGDTGEPAFNFV